jgi:hypothetical protein
MAGDRGSPHRKMSGFFLFGGPAAAAGGTHWNRTKTDRCGQTGVDRRDDWSRRRIYPIIIYLLGRLICPI